MTLDEFIEELVRIRNSYDNPDFAGKALVMVWEDRKSVTNVRQEYWACNPPKLAAIHISTKAKDKSKNEDLS